MVLLSRETSQPTLLLVEAKNTASGHTESERQLRGQLKRLGLTRFEIDKLGTKGAYATVTVSGTYGATVRRGS